MSESGTPEGQTPTPRIKLNVNVKVRRGDEEQSPTQSWRVSLDSSHTGAKKCWYCKGGEQIENNLTLYRFCKCKDEREWAHLHCLSWYLVTIGERDCKCSKCNFVYKNWRIKAIRRGTRKRGIIEQVTCGPKILGCHIWWLKSAQWLLFVTNSCYTVYDAYNHIKREIYVDIPTKWNTGDSKSRKIWEDIKILFPLVLNLWRFCFPPFKIVWWNYFSWKNEVGDYIIFNDYKPGTNNQLIAYHLREAARMRERWAEGYEWDLKLWFDRQNNDQGTNYEDFARFAPQPHSYNIWQRLKYWLWEERFD